MDGEWGEIADWTRERPRKFWDPGRKLLKAVRDYQRVRGAGPLARARRKLIGWRHLFWGVVTQCDIPLTVEIGGGLLLPHPNGIVIHPDARIGPNCLLMQQVTLGVSGSRPGAPVLGARVDVSCGARIIGPVTVNERATVAANAVVIKDVASGDLVGGVPARVIRSAIHRIADYAPAAE